MPANVAEVLARLTRALKEIREMPAGPRTAGGYTQHGHHVSFPLPIKVELPTEVQRAGD